MVISPLFFVINHSDITLSDRTANSSTVPRCILVELLAWQILIVGGSLTNNLWLLVLFL